MSPSRVFTFSCLLGLVSSLQAQDLTKIERKIAKEPAYQLQPKYLLLVYGKYAQTRVWLVLDGETLFVDSDGSGDLTANGKRFDKPAKLDKAPAPALTEVATYPEIEISEPDGLKHKLTVSISRPQGLWSISSHGQYQQWAGNVTDGKLKPADRRQDAPIVHFNGPIRFFLAERDRPETQSLPIRFVAGRENPLKFRLGTPGLGAGTLAHFNPALLPKNSKLLGGQSPVAEVEYLPTPGQNAGQKTTISLSMF